MKKHYTILVFAFTFFLVPCLCWGQNWDSVGAGTNGSVNAMVSNNGNLYVAGRFTKAGGMSANNIAVWNGTSWSAAGTGVNGPIFAIAAYNGNIYVGGTFTTAGGNPSNNIAEWNGSTWLPLGTGITVGTWGVYNLAIFNSKLIAGGIFTNAGGIPVNNIASWDGTKWDSLSSGLRLHPYGSVLGMAVYDSVLYVGGSFDSAGPVPANNIAQWDGANWSALSSGIGSGYPYCMTVFHQSLYTAGNFGSAGGNPVNGIAKWNGASWSSVISGSIGGSPWAISVFNGELILGGEFDATYNGSHALDVAYLNGASLDSLGSGFTEDTGVYALCAYNSELYAGGRIAISGRTKTDHIGRWTYPTGINDVKVESEKMNVYPNPSSGVFTMEMKSEKLKVKNIEVFNVLGQKVTVETLRQVQGDNLIDLSVQPSGVYLYRVVGENGEMIGEGKLVIEK